MLLAVHYGYLAVAVYLASPELSGAFQSCDHLLAHKCTLCARLTGAGSSLQRWSWLALLVQLRLAKSLAGAGTSRMVHSRVRGSAAVATSLSSPTPTPPHTSIMTPQTFHIVTGS